MTRSLLLRFLYRNSLFFILCWIGNDRLLLNAEDPRSKKPAQQHKEEKKAPPKGDIWSVDDVILAEQASDMHLSPDSRWAAWVKRAPDKEKNEMVAHLMLSSLTETKEIQLTRGSHSSIGPQWSPDGKLVAFLSSRPTPKGKRDGDEDKDEPKQQIWLINPFGGEPWVLTQSPRDIRQFAWMNSETILFVAQEKMGQYESKLKDQKDASQVIDDERNEPPVRLWQVTLKEKKSERITENTDRIQSLALSPDGRFAVTIHERSLTYSFDHKLKPQVFLYDLQKGVHRQIFTESFFNISNIYWDLDSKSFYALNQFTHHPKYLMAYIEELYHYVLADKAATRVDLSWQRGLADSGAGFAVTRDGFVALLANGVRHEARRYIRKDRGWQTHALGLKNTQAVRVSKDSNTIMYLESSATEPPRWYRARLAQDAVQESVVLTDLQSDLRKKPRARTETFRWKGALDEEVEGLVSYPHEYQAGKKYPLVVLIHGGPFWADFDFWDERWAYVRNLLCARGAFVLRPNYHGSSNYGLDWAESIRDGKYYTLPVEDIEKGIDALVSQGAIEPGKIALGGWSNGAILTMALIARRNYQAASAGAGGSEWVADWGTCEFGMSFSNYYLGKSPIEDPDLYRKNAPFFDFVKVRTPILLFHGSEDRNVPTHHGWMQFRALQQIGKTDVRFLLFPGEKHGLKKLAHQRRKVEEELAWFDKHLFRTVKSKPPSLKDDAPLRRILALNKTARHGRLYGLWDKGKLIPELVEYKEMRIGRFEVTRAQYAQFDPKYTPEPGTENYPASGITFEQARAYCDWLTRHTGRHYRLGRVKEMEPLYEDSDQPENTLDYWAGYALNPEDRSQLAATLKELDGQAPLLKEVGSFRSADASIGIFDLGGNVAEWADDGGKGKTMGGSADLATGERRLRAPAASYIGFRVLSTEPLATPPARP